MRDDERPDCGGAVVEREDGSGHDQARCNLPEDEQLAADGVREEEIARPLLVLRDERVRREQHATEDREQAAERRERRDEPIRSRGVWDAEGRRQAEEQADNQPDEDQDTQEPTAPDVLPNLVARDSDDLGEGTRGHSRSDSWIRSR